MKKRTLYLGLRPKPGTIHYPVIRTVYLGGIEPALERWSEFTHVVFTSQTTVDYWPGPWDKEVIAIGAATAAALRRRNLEPTIASDATQEGVLELLVQVRGYFFIPRSKQARSFLTDSLIEKGIPFLALDLYDTVLQKLEPAPNLNEFDEIIFTSPSTVRGFLEIYRRLPDDKKLTAIGPVTCKFLENLRSSL